MTDIITKEQTSSGGEEEGMAFYSGDSDQGRGIAANAKAAGKPARGDASTSGAESGREEEARTRNKKASKKKAKNPLNSSGSDAGVRSRSKARGTRKEKRDSSRGEEEEYIPPSGTEEPSEDRDVEFIEIDDSQASLTTRTRQVKPIPLKLTPEQVAQSVGILNETVAAVAQMGGSKDCPSLVGKNLEEKRGRSVETGEYYIGQLRKGQRELIQRMRELKALRDPMALTNLSANRRREEENAMKEFEMAPLSLLPEAILEGINGIDEVSQKSKSLKGTYQGRLNKSAARIKAALTMMIKRYETPENAKEREWEMERLREHIVEQEKEIASLHDIRVQHAETQKELYDLRFEMEVTKRQMEESQSSQRYPSRIRLGAKRRKVLPLQEEFSSEEERDEMEPDNRAPDPGMDRMEVEQTLPPPAEEEENVKSTRDEVLAEIAVSGMPAAIRPPLQGKTRVIDPAFAGSSAGSSAPVPSQEKPPQESAQGLEGRLASMLVLCVNEKITRLGQEIRAEIGSDIKELKGMFAPMLGNRGTEGNKKTPAMSVAPAKAGKKGRKGGIKETPVPVPVPTQIPYATRSQVQGQSRAIPVPTSATPKAWSQVLGRKSPAPTRAEAAALGSREREKGTPPLASGSNDAMEWTEVKKRKPKKAGGQAGAAKAPPATKRPTQPGGSKEGKSGAGGGKKGKSGGSSSPLTPAQQGKTVKRRVPRTAAVTLTCPPEKYAEYMGEVRQKINLTEVGITKIPKVRRTATGALCLELSGQNSAEKADVLAARMANALKDKEGVEVKRPTMTADVRLSGFEGSVTEGEVALAIAIKGGSAPSAISVGPIRKTAGGLCTVVAKCPLVVANRLAKEGKVALGWSSTKVTMLEKRPLQCYKCMEMGHTRATCRSEADHSGSCYRCGGAGHPARECTTPVRCAVCAGKGLADNHRVGGPACTGSRRGKSKGGGKGERAAAKAAARPVDSLKPKPAKTPAKKVLPAKEKPKTTSVIEVRGFQVMSDGRVIAGEVGTDIPGSEPPKPQREKKKKRETKPPPRKVEETMEVETEVTPPPTEEQAGSPAADTPPMTEGADKEEVHMEVDGTEEEGDTVPETEEKEAAEGSAGYM